MILKINGMENYLDFVTDNIFVMEILHKGVFYNTTQTIYNLCNKQETCEQLFFCENGNIVDISRNCIFISDILSVDNIIKNLSSKLSQYICDNASVCDNYYINAMKNIQSISCDIYNIVSELDISVNFKKDLIFSDIIKCMSPDIEFSRIDMLDRMQKIIDAVSTLKTCDFIIIPHIKEYLEGSALMRLYEYAFHKNIKLLLLESKENLPVKYEKIWRIDSDLSDNIIVL